MHVSLNCMFSGNLIIWSISNFQDYSTTDHRIICMHVTIMLMFSLEIGLKGFSFSVLSTFSYEEGFRFSKYVLYRKRVFLFDSQAPRVPNETWRNTARPIAGAAGVNPTNIFYFFFWLGLMQVCVLSFVTIDVPKEEKKMENIVPWDGFKFPQPSSCSSWSLFQLR